MEVATDIYTNGKRHVALVGVCHVAESSFWESLSRRIAGYESMGYSVQCEKIVNDLKTDKEKSQGTSDLYRRVAELTRLRSQTDALEYRDHWRNTDLTLSQLLEYGPSARSLIGMVSEASGVLEKLVSLGGSERVGRDIRFGLRWMPVVRHFVPQNREWQGIVIDLRNVFAADAILNAEGNVVSIWGAGHLKGIGGLLKDEGFRRESRVWSTAVAACPSE